MRKIFVIDDNRELLGLVKAFLRKKGFKVSVFTDWLPAMQSIRKHRPELVILDVFLKNFDGLDLCNKLRSHPVTRRIPVLVFSGLSRVADTAIHEYGANGFISKPFSMPDLMAEIAGILRLPDPYPVKRILPKVSFPLINPQLPKALSLKRVAVPVFAFINTLGYFIKKLPARRQKPQLYGI